MVGSDRELRLNLPDGRQLEVLADGPADGLPLLFHSGTPCGAVRYGPLVEAAARRELRTIVYSRPGYGTSTAKHGRSIAHAVKDVEAILAELGADEFVTIGWSGRRPARAGVRDWGFDLAKIERPVAVWQGQQDRIGALHARTMARGTHSEYTGAPGPR